MDRNKVKKQFSKGIKVLFEQLFKENAKFNRYVYGKIVTVNGDGTFDVEINESISTLTARTGLNLEVGNVVQIIVVNNEYSKKFIDDIRLT